MMKTRRGLAGAILLGSAMVTGLSLPQAARAQLVNSDQQEQQQRLVDRATLAAQDILDWRENGDQAQRFLAHAKGVVICPNIFRMSFVFGGSGGGCVLLARDGSGSWSAPAFYAMGSGSFGLQAGVQDAELMMFIMTRKGLTAIMDSHFKLGANASITLATLGAGMEGATTTALRADIVAVEKSSGLFAGLSLQGTVLSYDGPGNRAYYGQPVGVEDIAVAMRVNNPGADPLRAVLMRYGSGRQENSPYPPPYRPGTPYGNNAYGSNNAYGNNDAGTGDTGGPMQLAPSAPVQSQSLPPPR
jgi:lipid-binding SYLF domain-containing protein